MALDLDMPGDPTTGEVIIILADQKPRRLRFDFRALRLLEVLVGVPFFEVYRLPYTDAGVVNVIYAGCASDARARREQWSPAIVKELLDKKEGGPPWIQASWALAFSMRKIEGMIEGAQPEKEEVRWSWGAAVQLCWRLLGFTPEEFWSLTPAEFDLLSRASLDKHKQERRFLATMVANMMNPHLRTPVSGDQLLGLPADRWASQMTPGELAQAIAEAWANEEERRAAPSN